jgi:hypothetical protein
MPLLAWVKSPATLPSPTPAAMARQHPDAPKQFGIRISDEVMELVSVIQECRQRNAQPITLAAVVEDAIKAYYDLLVERGQINDKE